MTAQEELIFPVLEVSGMWYRALTTCGTEAWLQHTDVHLVYPEDPTLPGPGFDLESATIVVDPGHGGRDLGAKGATGLWESHLNLEIATGVRDLLRSSHSIDWETGEIAAGTTYPAVKTVWMTRFPEGPEDGEVELSLGYRAGIANGSGADALVAIHNNSSPARTTTTPGSDVFYAVSSPGSDRLASLIHEELVRGLRPLGDGWGAARVPGVKTRVDADTGDDYYGLLRVTEAPAVIVEGTYISREAEETLMSTEAGRQAYSDAVYRGLVRFLTTDEFGSAIQEPTPFNDDVGTVTTKACVVPLQP